MSYSFGIFPFRMAYRQNSHMHTQSQTISQANIADEYSATAENSETVGVALADPPPPRAAEIGPQKRTRTPLAMRPFAFAPISWIEGSDARCTARCVPVCGRFKMKRQKQRRPLLHSS